MSIRNTTIFTVSVVLLWFLIVSYSLGAVIVSQQFDGSDESGDQTINVCQPLGQINNASTTVTSLTWRISATSSPSYGYAGIIERDSEVACNTLTSDVPDYFITSTTTSQVKTNIWESVGAMDFDPASEKFYYIKFSNSFPGEIVKIVGSDNANSYISPFSGGIGDMTDAGNATAVLDIYFKVESNSVGTDIVFTSPEDNVATSTSVWISGSYINDYGSSFNPSFNFLRIITTNNDTGAVTSQDSFPVGFSVASSTFGFYSNNC